MLRSPWYAFSICHATMVEESFHKDFDKILEKHFRAQAEMLDQRFALIDARFVEMDKKWDEKLDKRVATLEARLETRLEAKLEPIRKDLTIVREGMKVVLEKLDGWSG